MSKSQATDPMPQRDAIAELLDLSDERDRYLERILAAELRGYRRGRADALVYAAELAADQESERHWHAKLAELARLSRDEEYLQLVRLKPPFHRSYDDNMALLLSRNPWVLKRDPEMQPYGYRDGAA